MMYQHDTFGASLFCERRFCTMSRVDVVDRPVDKQKGEDVGEKKFDVPSTSKNDLHTLQLSIIEETNVGLEKKKSACNQAYDQVRSTEAEWREQLHLPKKTKSGDAVNEPLRSENALPFRTEILDPAATASARANNETADTVAKFLTADFATETKTAPRTKKNTADLHSNQTKAPPAAAVSEGKKQSPQSIGQTNELRASNVPTSKRGKVTRPSIQPQSKEGAASIPPSTTVEKASTNQAEETNADVRSNESAQPTPIFKNENVVNSTQKTEGIPDVEEPNPSLELRSYAEPPQ
ncbi:hypothetical protein HY213_05230 [Candidatus Peregrinibacteria bacterium]|nr:hypothetical protein [Candidatus Peregrinibacteria bacterium]